MSPTRTLSIDAATMAQQLKSIFGADRVKTDASTLAAYSEDMSESPQKKPDVVVMAKTREEIVALVKWANTTRVPIVPAMARTNLGGLALAEEGGVILDLTWMNRILEINTTE